MSSDIAISVKGLGKKYTIGKSQGSYRTFRDTFVEGIKKPFQRLMNKNHDSSRTETIWALKDVSFEVKCGEIIGIIGRNGAGKSTLLRILSRITEPTEGVVDLYGRVGSLLEVGTGFHGELTGRENTYLYGSILGMTRREIEQRFDEIVDFAEIEKFLDTPVKYYSTGMYVRLAFSVAAHLNPEILLVDEVLAVGDSAFQKKCLGKMSQVATIGRTVLIVSHTMPAIQSLCNSGIVLQNGKIIFNGNVKQAIETYLSRNEPSDSGFDLAAIQNRSGSGSIRFTKFWIEDINGNRISNISTGDDCSLVVEYISTQTESNQNLRVFFFITTLMGAPVAEINTYFNNQDFYSIPQRAQVRFRIDKLPLTAGRYFIDLHAATHGGFVVADFVHNVVTFDVSEGDYYGTGRPGNPNAPVMLAGGWELEPINESV